MQLRTTTEMTTNSLISYMQTNLRNYSKLSEEISTGSRVLVPSDDPIAAIDILNDTTEINKLSGYNTNISTAQGEINVTDGALTSIISTLQKAHDLAVQAANGTNSSTSLSAIKSQVDQIIQNIKDLGNTKFNGTYIFGGTNTTNPPFSDNPTGGMTYNGTPSTGNCERYTQVSENSNKAINVTGDSVLGSYDTTTGTGSGAMESLYKLSKALGDSSYTDIKSCVGTLLTNIDTVTNERTNIAALTNSLTATTTSNANKITLLKESKGDAQNVDMATAVTDLYTAQTSYQASMSVVSQLLKLGSLWDYMS